MNSPFSIESRPCKQCKHSKNIAPASPFGSWICKRWLMAITPNLRVTYDAEDGTCFEAEEVLGDEDHQSQGG